MTMSMERIASILAQTPKGQKITLCAWVRTFRNTQFIALQDGSSTEPLQAVIQAHNFPEELIKKINTGACLEITGTLAESLGKGQSVELHVSDLKILGECDASVYPLQPKKHSLEFLREIGHLRMRSQVFGAVFRVRHHLSFAVHQFFNQKGFFNLHTPIITASDAEGAGELFHVTTLNLNDLPKDSAGKVDFSQDFFGTEAHLTVSGQLQGELGAMALGQIYTFGPTFRAENSNTTRHLSEFWMIEPEMAFYNLQDNMDLAEEFLKYLCNYALTHAKDEIKLLSEREAEEQKQLPQEKRNSMTLAERLAFVVDSPFERITYTEAVKILEQSKPHKNGKFQFPVAWGLELQSEHERYLVEQHFKKPAIITGYPAAFKAFYMRMNDDGKTVAAMDVLFPGIGEIMGGSQREERLAILEQKCQTSGIDPQTLWWYLDTRRFGTCVHSGFGLGFERLVMFVTGMTNIRDVIPFPRTPKSANF